MRETTATPVQNEPTATPVRKAPDGISCSLSERPLYAVLRRIQRERLTGTLTLAREDQSRLLVFEEGELRSARSSREEHRIGNALVRWGYLSAENLESALAIQAEEGGRIDQVLVERGLVCRSVLDDEVRRLMEEIVLSVLSWSSGTCHFLPGPAVADSDAAFSLSTTEMIIESIRRVPESEQFLERLGDLSLVARPGEELALHADSVRLPGDAAYLLSRVDGKTSLENLLRLLPGPRAAAAKLLYTLFYCGFIEVRRPAGGTSPTSGRPVPPPSPVPEGSHRQLVETIYRRIDWLSHYDLLDVPRQATAGVIEKAYRFRLRLYDSSLASRPELAGCRKKLAVLSTRVHAAFEVLSHPSSRKEYDRAIAEAAVQPVATDLPVARVSDEAADRAMASARRDTASHNFRRAGELVARKQYFPAIEMLHEAVLFEPQNANYRRLLGIALIENPYWREEAIEHLEEAARLEPGWADVHGRLAEAHLEDGAPEKALASARTALNVATESEKARYFKFELRVEEALAVARDARRTNSFLRLVRMA